MVTTIRTITAMITHVTTTMIIPTITTPETIHTCASIRSGPGRSVGLPGDRAEDVIATA